ncbi:B12-binding domain-containing radical SAM protein [Patescibacteria group bacterium]|nr:B12-binding domain-containing radical SAM protein [Patescibacteria group bacterium]
MSLHPDESRAVSDIISMQPMAVGFSILYSYMMADSYRMIEKLRENGFIGHITVGGTYPTLNTEEILHRFPAIDSVVRVEGELTTYELLRAVNNEIKMDDVNGLTFRQNDQIVNNPPRPLVVNLDDLPFPIRDDFETYVSLGGIIQIHTSRGCHANCSFCSTAAFYRKAPGRKWRMHSPNNAIDELEALLARSATNEVWFTDDNFIGPGKVGDDRANQIAQEIVRRGLKAKLIIQSRGDNLQRTTIRNLKQAGLRKVYIGIESGVNRSLDMFNKRMNREQNANALKLLEEEEIFVEIGFIGFDPFTNREEFAKNVEFLSSLCGKSEYIHPFAFDMLLPYRGTPICELMLKHCKAVEHGLDYQSVISDPRIELAWHLTDALLADLGPATECIKSLIIDDNSREEAKCSIRLKNATMMGCLAQIRDAIFRLAEDEVVSTENHPLFGFIHASAEALKVNLGITQGDGKP